MNMRARGTHQRMTMTSFAEAVGCLNIKIDKEVNVPKSGRNEHKRPPQRMMSFDPGRLKGK